jgi:hypothetical protein
MRSLDRKIVIVNQAMDQRSLTCNQLVMSGEDCFFLDPIKLFAQLDWTKFEDSAEVINIVYADLFESIVMENKSLICYWPNLNFPDDLFFELLGHCKSADIQVMINYINDQSNIDDEMLPEYQQLWKSFILFMVNSLCEDLQFNKGFEEIASLKTSTESILLFKMEKNRESKFSYFLSVDSFFELEPNFNMQHQFDVNSAPLFDSFEHMMEKLHLEIDLEKYSATFSNRAMEKVYFHSIIKKSTSKNLITHWIENYSEN